MQHRISALLGVRSFTCTLLICSTLALYILDHADAAQSMMTLTSVAVGWMFKSRSDREIQK